jgi:prepilin-type N-terminal cleavage/methylation domain-containing protein/prepilin-type processing-associated H-X9-DG protein
MSQSQSTIQTRRAFTLVELLVVIAIIGVIAALLLTAISGVRASARRLQCSHRMRQLGTAIHTYAETNGGRFPTAAGHGASFTESWVFKLARHLEEVDVVRVCPNDPEAQLRMNDHLTSYVLNGYLADVEDHDHEHEHEGEHEHEEHGEHEHDHRLFKYLSKLQSLSTTVVLVESADGAHVDHVDSFEWFSDENIAARTVFEAIQREVAIHRHGDASNFLYADNHVDALDASEIRRFSLEGSEHNNFIHPQD